MCILGFMYSNLSSCPIFSTNLSETFDTPRRNERRMIENVYIGVHVQYPIFLSNLMKLEFSRQIFEISSNITFHKHPCNGFRVVPRWLVGRTDRHDEANIRFSPFCQHTREGEMILDTNFNNSIEDPCWIRE